MTDNQREQLAWALGEAHKAAEQREYPRAYGLLRGAALGAMFKAEECWCGLPDPRIVGNAPCRRHNVCPVCGDSWATHSGGQVLRDDDGEEHEVDEDRFVCGAGHVWEGSKILTDGQLVSR